ncbi:hypothetical protein [uncultured Methylobacterium sp.]|jgi:hypothetical protein|uniref:hypothetical protein n=1 Tax=uncultured Methylobacterium sp. TaxID=157278 RepID=UPI002609417A|nr:hypothetical protein [uncultured Methylobacterium sp.]
MSDGGVMMDAELPGLEDQVRRVLAASQHLVEQTVLLGVAIHLFWLDQWTRPVLAAAAAQTEWRARQARRDRLVRRGVPDHLARQGLRLVWNPPRRPTGSR